MKETQSKTKNKREVVTLSCFLFFFITVGILTYFYVYISLSFYVGISDNVELSRYVIVYRMFAFLSEFQNTQGKENVMELR